MYPSQLCTLIVGDSLFGVDVLRVQEVLRNQPMTVVPRSHPTVGGLINLRGQIVTAIDLRLRLDLPASTTPESRMNVVIRTDEGAVSFLVDGIGDVVELADVEREPVPDTLPPHLRELIIAVYKLDDALLLQLDADRLVELPTAADVAA